MLLRVHALRVVYPVRGRAPVEAVAGVSFDLPSGASFGIVGESGCGKSSLAKALMGLHVPASGTICFEGTALSDLTSSQLHGYRRAVQMVFQDAAGSLNPRMTVRQTLAEVLRVHRMVERNRVDARISELLDRVGLASSVLDVYPREISGGQCQRVSLARCLALEPRLIIADEPVSALDVSVQARILNLIRSLQKELDLAVILISHDLAVVRNICDRVAVMQAGRFVDCGIATEVLDHPRHAYTRTLLAAVPDIDRALASRKSER